jgi:signal transduction histidine kinase
MRGGGLLRLSESTIVSDIALDGLTNDGVRAMAVAPDGDVWVATGHSLNRFASSRRDVYDLAQTMALHTDRGGVLWASTANGVGRFVNGRFDLVSAAPQIKWGRVVSFTTDAEGTLWLCSSQQGLVALDGESLSFFDDDAAVGRQPCAFTYSDRHNRVWVGSTSGRVALYEKGAFRSFGEHDGLGRGRVTAILEDRSGALWLSTASALSRFDNGRFTSLTSENGPITGVVPTLVEDGEGYLWLGVNGGAAVMRVHPREMDRRSLDPAHQIEYALYDGSDGMLGELHWLSGATGARAGDGRLWFATGLGVAVFDPGNLPRAVRLSAPRVEVVAADGRRTAPTRDLSIPSGTSTLRVEYGAISLSGASKLRFRFMLEGFDDDWVYAGPMREAAYTGLPAGSYRFRASATSDGQWTEAAVWDFSIAAPFYRRPWFYGIELAAVGLLVVMAWGLRVRAMRRRYALVFEERARVSREIHDTLLQSLGAIGLELETIATQLDSSQDAPRDSLRRLRRQVGHALREARESIWELRDTAMETHGLADSLRKLAETIATTKGVRTEVTVHGRPRRCSVEVDTQLFRIAQEAINNAIRHGHATHIQVAVDYQKDRIALSVSDNGCGFTADEQDTAAGRGEHLGILSMRERAARIRGRLAIASGPGKGTTIEASGPLMVE